MRLFSIANALIVSVQAASSIRPNLRSAIWNADSNRTLAANLDRVINLPGLPVNSEVEQFSGYLTVDRRTNRKIFYWYVESLSDPSTDPVVLWTNGGPGCSGLLGFGTEQGPFHIGKNGNLTNNPWAWNRIANMLFVEQPAGVGFSYSDDKRDYRTGDKKAAIDNFELIKQFFMKFPERQSNPFYIASESYGGHYMPQLAQMILERDVDESINFQGFLVGNPYVNSYTNSIAQYRQMYYDGLTPMPLYTEWEMKCTKGEALFFVNACPDIESRIYIEMGKGINPYALDYPVCKDSLSDQEKQIGSQGLKLLHQTLDESIIRKSFLSKKSILSGRNSYEPCSEEYLLTYLNREDVREALHVEESVGNWTTCSYDVKYEVKDRFTTQTPLYRKLVTERNDLDILIFSGDNDSVCPTSGTQDWVFKLGVEPKTGRMWNPWYGIDSQVAGYKTEFDVNSGKLIFATVHGAGHEVPAYKPMQAFLLFKDFITSDEFIF